MSFHDTANGPTDMHGPYARVFANTAARTGDATVYTAAQSVAGGSLNPITAFQTDTSTEYVLTNHSPTTWVALGAAGGEVNLGANVGTTGAGTAGPFRDKTGVTLNFRRLLQSGSVTITENANDITISAPASSGEANLAANVGTTGAGTAGSFRDKTGVTLNFRRLLQGGAVTITENADDITISAPASSGEANTGANVGVGDAGVFRDKTGTTLNFRRLVGAGAATITENADTITISTSAASGEANTASNVGTGVGTFKQKVALNLEMRSVTGVGVVTAALVSDDIQISSTAEANTGANVGTTGAGTAGSFRDKTGTTLNFRRIVQAGLLTVTEAADTITLNTTAENNTAANVGGGVGNIFRDKTGSTINLRTLVQGASMLLTQAADTVTVALGTLSQTLNAGNQLITDIRTATFGAEFDAGNSGAAATITWPNKQKQRLTLTANTTLTFAVPTGAGNFLLRLIQDATGNRTVTWPGTVRWPGGTAPAISSGGPNTIHIVSFYYDGTNYYGVGNLSFA